MSIYRKPAEQEVYPVRKESFRQYLSTRWRREMWFEQPNKLPQCQGFPIPKWVRMLTFTVITWGAAGSVVFGLHKCLPRHETPQQKVCP